MANIKSFPNNQDEYIGAEYVMKWLHGRTSGVFAGDDNAAVTALSTPAMAVQVADGTGWMANTGKDGVVWWIDDEAQNNAKLQLTIDAADGVLNRIDRVIVEWKTTNYVDLPEVKVLKGTTASRPTAPALTNNSTVRQISLAQVYIAAGTTEITASMITDERLDATVCGLVTESVAIDTSTMDAQFNAMLDETREKTETVLADISKELADIETGAYVSRFSTYSVTIPASGWSDNLQTVAVTGVTADQTATDVIVSPDPADDNRAAYLENDVRIHAQQDGAVQFKCENTPDIDLVVSVMVRKDGTE